MSDFKLDTSGEVRVYTNVGEPGGTRKRDWRWSDLDPFTQGYIEAVFASTTGRTAGVTFEAFRDRGYKPVGFSHLAPETLVRIMEDCAAFRAWKPDVEMTAKDGAWFWNHRQAIGWPDFPSLTVYLGDDGLVRFQ